MTCALARPIRPPIVSEGTPPPIRYQEIAPKLPLEGDVDLAAIIDGDGPLELDIGFGHGSSIYERAAQAPESRLLGIEIKNKWATKVAERCARRGLTNVRVFANDARDILRRGGPPGCLQRVFVHFPDPWWKRRHAKRMVVGGELLDDLARLLTVGGELLVQTDVEARAQEYRAAMFMHPHFQLAGEGGWLDHNPFGARSNREIRAEEDGLPIYRLLAVRV